jgi:imidazolonepropionase-like amidohydrolase
MLKFIIGAVAALTPAAAGAETIVIHAGRLIADAASPARGASTVIVTDGRIASVVDGHQPAVEGARLVDLKDKTVLPGLIDAHVHLTGDPGTPFWQEAILTSEDGVAYGLKNARITLAAGFTTVRDLGAAPEAIYAVRDAIAAGLHPGPRVVAAGTAVSIIGGHGDVSGFAPAVVKALEGNNTCTGPEACAARVREFSRAGANVIKITATGGVLSQQGRGLEAHFTDAELAAIVRTARSLGLKVAAHAHGARGIEAAARAGVDSIDHGTFLDAAGLKAMQASGSWYVPTLMAFQGISERLGKGVYTPTVEAKVRATLGTWGKGLNAAYKAGIPIGFGTDAGVFEHGRNGEEAALMVKYGGMSPRDVLISATSGAARLLGVEAETGTIEAGKSADIIAVDGNPQSDATALTRVGFVMAAGRILD